MFLCVFCEQESAGDISNCVWVSKNDNSRENFPRNLPYLEERASCLVSLLDLAFSLEPGVGIPGVESIL
jgi:hypothetical protein